jgi:hypothetical protein
MANSATITPVLAAGSVASPYLFQVNISQRLCNSTCVAQTPVFNPTFSLVGYSSVSTTGYVATVHVEGVVAYIPCNGNSCCTKTQLISQNFTLPFYSATAPTSVSVAQGTAVNSVAASACQNCSRTFVSETPVTLTVATA